MLSHPELVSLIDDGFVPAWESIRSAPRLSIRFGDRTIERTLRGNITWFVLTPEGGVVDLWPGVYDPAAFVTALRESQGIYASARASDPELGEGFAAVVRRMHASAAGRSGGLVRTGFAGAPPDATSWRFVTPLASLMRARSKAIVEMPLEVILDEEALPSGADAAARSAWLGTTLTTPATASRSVAPLEADTVHHLSVKRPRVHEVLGDGEGALAARDAFTKLAFEELGGIPLDDPWLGFAPLATDAPRRAPASTPVASIAWHADLDAARSAAKLTARPILLLASVGERASFPAWTDPAVAAIVSGSTEPVHVRVREAPVAVLDMGDGERVMNRTLRGAAVAVLLDPRDGSATDAVFVPGDDPAALGRALTDAVLAGRPAASDAPQMSMAVTVDPAVQAQIELMTRAELGRVAISKGAVERPVIRDLQKLRFTRELEVARPAAAQSPATAMVKRLRAAGEATDAMAVARALLRDVAGLDPDDPILGLDGLELDDTRLAAIARGEVTP